MNIKNNLNKIYKISPFGLLAIEFVVGLLVMYLYYQPKLTDQVKTTNKWVASSNQYNKWAGEWKQLYFTSSEKLKALQNKPTPTPQIVYQTQTQYVQEPAQNTNTALRCNSDLLGGEYCTSSTGVRTHCTSNLLGGMNCN